MIIRPTKTLDWKVIQKLNHEVFLDNAKYDKYEKIDWPFSQAGIKYYKKAVSSKAYCCLIAEINHHPVGYIIGTHKKCSYRSNKMAEIENMGVSPDFRSKGIGAKLIDNFKKWCQQKKFTHIYVNAYYANKKAIKFYKNQGLKPFSYSFEGNI